MNAKVLQWLFFVLNTGLKHLFVEYIQDLGGNELSIAIFLACENFPLSLSAPKTDRKGGGRDEDPLPCVEEWLELGEGVYIATSVYTRIYRYLDMRRS